MSGSASVNTLLGPGTKRARGSADQIQAQLKNTDFELAREQWGFDSCPADWMDAVIAKAEVSSEHSVLIPCAGQGLLADRITEKLGYNGYRVLEVQEREAQLRDLLSVKGYRLADVYDLMSAEGTDLYNRIVCFPPHHRGREADYLRQCYRLLAPVGRLCAIVADSVFYHSRPECHEFRILFRTLRRLGRAGYERLEDEVQDDESGQGEGSGQPEDSEHASPQPEPEPGDDEEGEDKESPGDEKPATKPSTGKGTRPRSGAPTDDDGDGGRAFEHDAPNQLASPFFSPPVLPPTKPHRPNPCQGRFWRLVWMQRGPQKYAEESLDDHGPFAPDDEALSLPKMRSRSIVPQRGRMPSLPKPQGGLQPSNPAQAPQGSSPPGDDAQAELELELELIRMRLGPQTLTGLPAKRRLTLARARLKLS